MTWARLDDQFYNHPKVAKLGDMLLPAVGLHALALCYCNAYLTDGFIPKDQIPRLTGDVTLLLPGGTPWVLVNDLLDAGLWEKAEGGYQIHDFLDYNPSRVEVLKEREARHEIRVAGGRARAASAKREGGRYVSKQHQQPTSRRTSRKPAAHQQAPQQETTRSPAPAPAPAPSPFPGKSTDSATVVAAAKMPGKKPDGKIIAGTGSA